MYYDTLQIHIKLFDVIKKAYLNLFVFMKPSDFL